MSLNMSMQEMMRIAKGKGGGKGGGMGGSSGMPAGMPDLATLLGPEAMKGMDPAELAKQAGQLWKMLDEMAETDEGAYTKFMQQQADGAAAEAEAERARADPEYATMMKLVDGTAPALVIECRVVSSPEPISKAIVELWAAKDGSGICDATVGATHDPITPSTRDFTGLRVPLQEARAPRAPAAPRAPPGAGGAPHAATGPMGLGGQQQGGGGAAALPNVRVYSVVASRGTVAAAMAGAPAALRIALAEAAVQFLEARHKLKLQRTPWRVLLHPGMLPDAEVAAREAAMQAAAGTAAAAGTSAEALSPGLLGQLSSMGLGRAAGAGKRGAMAGVGVGGGGPAGAGAGRGGGGKGAAPHKRPLIVDLAAGAVGGPPPVPAGSAKDSSTGGEDMGGTGGARAAAPASAPVSVVVQEASAPAPVSVSVCVEEGASGREVVVTASLPGVASAADVDVDVANGGTRVVLSLTSGAALGQSDLPCRVDAGAARAKFDKRRRVLTVRFPCADDSA